MTYIGFCEEISTLHAPIWPGPKITPEPSYSRGTEKSMYRFLCWGIFCTGQRMGELCSGLSTARETSEEGLGGTGTRRTNPLRRQSGISALCALMQICRWKRNFLFVNSPTGNMGEFLRPNIVLCCKKVLWPLWGWGCCVWNGREFIFFLLLFVSCSPACLF